MGQDTDLDIEDDEKHYSIQQENPTQHQRPHTRDPMEKRRLQQAPSKKQRTERHLQEQRGPHTIEIIELDEPTEDVWQTILQGQTGKLINSWSKWIATVTRV